MLESSLLAHFRELPDPRMVNKCDHLLIDIVMIAICATLANADGWEDIALFAEGKSQWLQQWLALPNGIPSPDTFRRVFENMDAAAFQHPFMGWVQAVFQLTEGQVIAIDGKTLRATCDSQGKSTLHLVSAWAADKANEIAAIPSLLEVLILKGCIVTLAAMGCQKSIVQQIRDQEADYVVTVKGNQPKLQRHIRAAFTVADEQGLRLTSPHYCQTDEIQHGRVETRQCWVVADQTAQRLGWSDCQRLIRIKRTTQRGLGKTSAETPYYISSLPPLASLVLGAVRAHWGIENSCHWILDVVFKEDASRTRTKNADANLALLRKIALNLIRQHPAKGSLKGKRYSAALNEDFLVQVLQSSFNLMR